MDTTPRSLRRFHVMADGPNARRSMLALAGKVALLVGTAALAEGTARFIDRGGEFQARIRRDLADPEDPFEARETRFWAHPEQIFRAPGGPFTQVLRYRPRGSPSPTGERLDLPSLPAGRRLFVLGESAAFGVGVDAEATFAAHLDRAFAPRGLRIINAGQPGADTHEVMDAGAQLLLGGSPAAMVVFTGNNLWVNWTPPQQPRGRPLVRRMLSALAASRAVALVEYAAFRMYFRSMATRGADTAFHDHYELVGSDYALLHPLRPTPGFGPADWDPLKQEYLQRFERSLRLLHAEARARGVPVVFVALPFNHRLSPSWKSPQFEAYDPAHAREVASRLHAAGALVQQHAFAPAEASLARALALDPEPPLLHYLHAQSLAGLGRNAEAEAEYAESRERTVGNLGSRRSVNAVVRRVAQDVGAAFVDAEAIFEADEHARGGWFNATLFVDDCHPNAYGHYLIARALGPVIEEALRGLPR